MYGLATDESFNLEKTNEYILSIQVSLDGFSFSVIASNDKKLLALNHTPVTISNPRFLSRRFTEWLLTETLLQHTYKETRLIIASDKFTLVPDSLYEPIKKIALIQPVCEFDATEIIHENFIEKFHAHLLFAASPQLNTQLKSTKVLHPVKLLLENTPEILTENGLILWFNYKGCYLILFSADKIIVANHFSITNENDILYYALATLKQLGIAPKKTEVLFAGEMAENESLQNSLQKYFISIRYLLPKDNIQIDPSVFSEPMHPFIHLFI